MKIKTITIASRLAQLEKRVQALEDAPGLDQDDVAAAIEDFFTEKETEERVRALGLRIAELLARRA